MQDNGLNIDHLRGDFPVFESGIAYLDSASSAQKPQSVIDAISNAMSSRYANIHRGLYDFSQVKTEEFEGVRERVASFIGARSSKEIIYTRNATEAINLVAQSWGRQHLREGDEIIISEMEHHANIVPWQLLRDQIGIKIKTIPVLDNGSLDLEAFERMLTPKTMLVSVVHISNALGTVNNVKKIIDIAKDFYPDMKVLIDGSQAVVHSDVDVLKLNADFYVFTGHKLYGPTGVGVLWGRYEVLESMPPYQGGGDMIEEVRFEQSTFKLPPARFEAGTPAIIEVIGLGAAIDYLGSVGMEAIHAHEDNMLSYGIDALKQIDGVRLIGEADDRAGIISFTADWGHPSDIGMILNECNVAVRTGHHCCQPLMSRFDIDATVRASIGLYTNKQDIDKLTEGLNKAKSMLG